MASGSRRSLWNLGRLVLLAPDQAACQKDYSAQKRDAHRFRHRSQGSAAAKSDLATNAYSDVELLVERVRPPEHGDNQGWCILIV